MLATETVNPRIRAKLEELARLRQELRRTTESVRHDPSPIVSADAEPELSTEIMLARGNINRFCEYVIRDQLTNEKIKLAAHHKQWFAHVGEAWQRGLTPVILAPAGSGKTSLVGEAAPLFILGRNPALRIKTFSATDENAIARISTCKTYIEKSVEYQQVFPHIQRDPEGTWNEHQATVKRPTISRDPSLHAVAIGGTAIGGRGDIMVLDDVNDAKNTILQPRLADKIWKTFTSVLISRDDRGMLMLIIATRWGQHDLVGRILADLAMRERYAILVQAITDDFDGIESEQFFGSGKSHTAMADTLQIKDLFAQHAEGLF